jgi:hypothetical protein
MNISKAMKKLQLLLLQNAHLMAFIVALGILGGSCGILTAQSDSSEPPLQSSNVTPHENLQPRFAPPPEFQPSPPKSGGINDEKKHPLIPPSRHLRRERHELPQEFEKNWQRWESMSLEERSFIRERAKEFRSEMKKQIDEALRSLGLQLEGEVRREFVREYLRGRREIEREIRDLMQKERESRINQLLEKLRAEFANKAAKVPSIENTPKEP